MYESFLAKNTKVVRVLCAYFDVKYLWKWKKKLKDYEMNRWKDK